MAEKKNGQQPQGAGDQSEFFRFDFDSVEVRSTGYKDPHVRIDWNSRQGKCSAGTSKAIVELSSRSAVGTDHPLILEVVGLTGSGNVGLRPVKEKNSSCVKVRWSKDLKKANLDLTKLLALTPIPMQKRTRAMIDVKMGTRGGVEILILEWENARVEAISPRKAGESGQSPQAAHQAQQPAKAGQAPSPEQSTGGLEQPDASQDQPPKAS